MSPACSPEEEADPALVAPPVPEPYMIYHLWAEQQHQTQAAPGDAEQRGEPQQDGQQAQDGQLAQDGQPAAQDHQGPPVEAQDGQQPQPASSGAGQPADGAAARAAGGPSR